MRIVIPGISGKLGKMLAVELLRRGHEVIGIDKRKFRDAPEGVEMHEVDIRKRAAEDVFRKRKPDAVIHLATVTHLMEHSEDRYRINLGGTRAVFEHAKTYGVSHVIFVGRHTYYGAAADAPLYHKEDEPPMALQHFPELADLVAADLFATTALWQKPEVTTTVLRMAYTLGPTGHGTLATFIRGPLVPTVLGFDPLFQFMHEEDVVRALVLTVEKRPRGVFNVAGPSPLPLSYVIKQAGRRQIPVPEMLIAVAMGRFGLPKLTRGALAHVKFPVIVDSSAFRAATGFEHKIDESQAIAAYREAFPITR
jgi:UDP-glucose 4-epimerase